MTPATQVLLSGALTFGVPLIIAARELIVLRRGRDGGWRPDGTQEPRPVPPRNGGSPGVKPLPACLIPVIAPTPAPTLGSPVRSAQELEPV